MVLIVLSGIGSDTEDINGNLGILKSLRIIHNAEDMINEYLFKIF